MRRRKRGKYDPTQDAEALAALPDQVRQALSNLPPSAQASLAQAPPEALEILRSFDTPTFSVESVTVNGEEVTDGPVDGQGLAGVLQSLGMDSDAVLGQLPGKVAEQLENALGEVDPEAISVTMSEPITWTSVSMASGPDTRLQVRFDRTGYGPGDLVEGVVVAGQRVKARELHVELGLVEQSPDYWEFKSADRQEALTRGNLTPGQHVRFSLRMPRDAAPNWDPLGEGRLDLARLGSLTWGVMITATRGGMVGHDKEYHRIPVDPDPTRWSGSTPASGSPAVTERVKGWDVDVNIPSWSPRRGEDVAVDVMIGDTTARRRALRAGLIAEVHSDVESRSNNQSGPPSTSRQTHVSVVHEAWVELDPTRQIQQVHLPVPRDLPYSHGEAKGKKLGSWNYSKSSRRANASGGTAFAVRWRLVVEEDRAGRRDARREVELDVRP